MLYLAYNQFCMFFFFSKSIEIKNSKAVYVNGRFFCARVYKKNKSSSMTKFVAFFKRKCIVPFSLYVSRSAVAISSLDMWLEFSYRTGITFFGSSSLKLENLFEITCIHHF